MINSLLWVLHSWQQFENRPGIHLAARILYDVELGLQLLCCLAVLARRREPAVTLAWLLGILLFPFIGMGLFWVFGRDRVRRSARPRLRLLAERRAEERDANLGAVPEGLRSLARTGWQTGRAPVTVGNRVDVLIDGAETYPAILSAIAAAEHTIDAAYYIFERDQTGRQFRDALCVAAQRGVRVRVLTDALGGMAFGFRAIFAPGMARFFKPLTLAGGTWLPFSPVNPFDGFSLNLRNHRKLLVVDGRIGFTGGLNIGDENVRRPGRSHSAKALAEDSKVAASALLAGDTAARFAPLAAWRDTDLRIEGPAAAQLQAVFADDWAFTTGGALETKPDLAQVPHAGDCPVQIVPSGPDDRAEAIFNVFFAAISTAKHTLDLSTPYFVPDQAIWVAIRSAAMRGVRVRILVPNQSDQPLTQAASRSYGEELMTAGVEFYRYLPGMMHAKCLIIDGEWATVGTANMDVRSFRLNFEVTALLYSPGPIARLQAAFDHDLSQSLVVDVHQFAERPYLRRIVEGFARLLSPVL